MRNGHIADIDLKHLTPVAAAALAKQLGRQGEAAALALYRSLQWGRRAKKIVRVHRPMSAPADFAQLGRLVDIELADGRIVNGGPEVLLTVGAVRKPRELWLLAAKGVQLGRKDRGSIFAITYATAKGARSLALYRHVFKSPRPDLDRDALGHAVIRRGRSRYDVNVRGIVG